MKPRESKRVSNILSIFLDQVASILFPRIIYKQHRRQDLPIWQPGSISMEIVSVSFSPHNCLMIFMHFQMISDISKKTPPSSKILPALRPLSKQGVLPAIKDELKSSHLSDNQKFGPIPTSRQSSNAVTLNGDDNDDIMTLQSLSSLNLLDGTDEKTPVPRTSHSLQQAWNEDDGVYFEDTDSSGKDSWEEEDYNDYEQAQLQEAIALSLASTSPQLKTESETLQKLLIKYGYKESDVSAPHDGHCQFHAMSRELSRVSHPYSRLSIRDLRHLAVSEIQSNATLYAPFLSEPLESYCQSMSVSGTGWSRESAAVRWGDEVTLVALVQALGVRVTVISSGHPIPLEYIPIEYYQPTKECMLYLCHWANLHYGVMEPVS